MIKLKTVLVAVKRKDLVEGGERWRWEVGSEMGCGEGEEAGKLSLAGVQVKHDRIQAREVPEFPEKGGLNLQDMVIN